MRAVSLQHPSSKLAGALQSILLLGLMMLLGGLVGRTILGGWGLTLALGFALVAFVLGSSASPRLALSLYRANELPVYRAPGLYGLINDLSERAELPARPRLFVSPSLNPNALTVGNASRPIIMVTQGLLNQLSARQLAGVLAHEMAHIRNGDTWLLGLADSVRRLTRGLSQLGFFVFLLNLPLVLFGQYGLPPGFLLMLIGAPAASLLLELALSRTREYEADRTAVELTTDPGGFASALRTLDGHRMSVLGWLMPRSQSAGAHLLRTHPPTEDRVRRIMGSTARPLVTPR